MDVLLWNERRVDSTPFLREFEQLLLSYGTDYQSVRHERTTEEIETFFAPSPFQVQTFEYLQQFDYPGIEGRLLSSSYTPQSDDVAYRPMVQELRSYIRRPSGKWTRGVRVQHAGLFRAAGVIFGQRCCLMRSRS